MCSFFIHPVCAGASQTWYLWQTETRIHDFPPPRRAKRSGMEYSMNGLMATEVVGTFPMSTLVCMVISGILLVAFPIVIGMYTKAKLEADVRDVAIGAVAYLLIGLIFVNVLSIAIQMIPGVQEAMKAHDALRIAAEMILNIVPEIGLLALFLRRRKEEKQNLGCYMEFMIGYTAVELVMVAATVMMSNAMIAFTYNGSGIEGVAEMAGISADGDFSYLNDMMAIPGFTYLLSGIEGCLLALVRIGFVVWMYMINKRGLSNRYYIVMAVMYALVKVPSALNTVGLLPTLAVDPIVALICMGCLAYEIVLMRRMIPDEVGPLFKKPEIEFHRKKKAKSQSKDQGFH